MPPPRDGRARGSRRRRSSRRAGGKGHDCGAHPPRLSHGGRRRAFLFRQTPEAEAPEGLDRARLHQYPTADLWQHLRLGIRKARACTEGVRVEGKLVFNNIALRVNAALAGSGLAYLYEDQVQEHVAEGRLVRVLGDWCPPFSGPSPLLSKPPTSHASVRFAGR